MSYLNKFKRQVNTQFVSIESSNEIKTLEDVFKSAGVPYDKAFDILKEGSYKGRYGTYLSEKDIVKYYNEISLSYETPKGWTQRIKSRWNAGTDKESQDVINGHSYKLFGKWHRRIPIMGSPKDGKHPIIGLTFLDFDPTYPKFKGQLLRVVSEAKILTRFDRHADAKKEMSNAHGIIVLKEVLQDLRGELEKSAVSTKVSQENINEYYSRSNPFTRKDWKFYFDHLVSNGVKVPKDVVQYFTTTDKPFIPTVYSDGEILNKESLDYLPPFYRDSKGKVTIANIDILKTITQEGYGSEWLKNINKYRTNKNPNQIKTLPSNEFGWIPLVLYSEHGVYPLVLDMDPDKGGKVGQIIYVQLADGYLDTTLLANSFSEFISKVSTESTNPFVNKIVGLIIRKVIVSIYKKYFHNAVREEWYHNTKYGRCSLKAIDHTWGKIKEINNTPFKDGFDVKDVPAKTFTNTFIVNDKQLTKEEDIYNAIDIVTKEVTTLNDVITNLTRQVKTFKVSNNTKEEDVTNFILKYVPKELVVQFTPSKEVTPLDTIEGCNDVDRIKRKLIVALRPDLYTAFTSYTKLIKDEKIDPNLRKTIETVVGKLFDKYTAFLEDVVEWIYRSIRRQSKVKPATESISVEDYLFSLEEIEEEEKQYDDAKDMDTDQELSDETTDDESSADNGTEDGSTDGESEDPSSEETGGAEAESGEESGEATDGEQGSRESEQDQTERSEVKLDEPDEEKDAIKTYLTPLLGDSISEISLFSASQVNRPLYHVSMNPNIGSFTPKVSKRTINKEDRSVPRISTSTSLIGCLNGYQSMVSDMEGRETKKFNGLFTVYDLPYQYALKPSKRLLADVDNSDEYWLVSWKKETYSVLPRKVADFTIPKIETVYGNDGKDYTYHCFIKVLDGYLYLDHQRKLSRGCYHVVLNGYNFKYPLKNNQLIQVHEISENEYNKVVALSMMIKKR